MNLILQPYAIEDFNESVEYYLTISDGLKERFIKELDIAFEKIKKNPKLYPLFTDLVRKKLLSTFPYIIYYIYENNTISIIAIFHTSRNPQKLKSRIR